MTAPTKSKFAGHKIVANKDGMHIARALSQEFGAEIVRVKCSRFPDKTIDVRVSDSLHGKDVIIVGHTRFGDDAVEVGLLQSALRGVGVKSIGTVIPHYPYGRQDKGKNGEPNGVELMAKVIGNTDWLIVVDPHKRSILKYFDGRAREARCTRELGEWLQDKMIDLVLAPDEGASHRAKDLGEFLGVPFDNYEKEHLNEFEVRVKPKKLTRPFGARIAIVDDMISGGGTMIAAAKAAREDGVSYVIAICTHGLLVGDALESLRAVCDEVVSTDTIRSEVAKISCVPAILRALAQNQ